MTITPELRVKINTANIALTDGFDNLIPATKIEIIAVAAIIIAGAIIHGISFASANNCCTFSPLVALSRSLIVRYLIF